MTSEDLRNLAKQFKADADGIANYHKRTNSDMGVTNTNIVLDLDARSTLLNEAASELERLTIQVAGLKRLVENTEFDAAEDAEVHAAEIANLTARVAELEAALKPFAAVANLMAPLVSANPERWPDDKPNHSFTPSEWPRWSDFRRASQAHKGEGK